MKIFDFLKKIVAHGCRKTKKLICGMEGEILVAHGRMPSPGHTIRQNVYKLFSVAHFSFARLRKISSI